MKPGVRLYCVEHPIAVRFHQRAWLILREGNPFLSVLIVGCGKEVRQSVAVKLQNGIGIFECNRGRDGPVVPLA
jgi:hypothetical protein